MDMTSDLSLQESCMAALRHMGIEVRALIYKTNELEAKNEKLRELVRKYGEYTDRDRCEGCACKSRCNDGDIDECWQLMEIRELERNLEVGVNG